MTFEEELGERMRDAPPRLRLVVARALVLALVSSIAVPVEWLVPVVRTASGRRGVHLGPPTGMLLAAAVAFEALDRSGERGTPPADPEAPAASRAPGAGLPAVQVLAPAAVLPAAGALLPGMVVLPRRSSLWGWAASAAARLAVCFLLAWDNERRKRREAAG